MNTNTSNGFRDLPAQVVTTASATALAWTNNSTPVLANGAALSLVTDQDLATGGTFDGNLFKVRIIGNASVSTTASTVTIGIYSGTVATGTLLKTIVSPSLTSAKTNFFLELDLLWDSNSQTVNGLCWGVAGTGTPANGALTASLTGVASAASLVFSAAVTFSGANAANTVQISELSVEIA